MANPFKTYLQGVAQRFKTPASPGSQFNKPKTTAAVVPSYNQGNSQNSGALTPGQFSSAQPIPTANNSATAVSAPKLSPAGNAYVAGLTQTNSPQAPINPTQNNPQQPIEPPAATPQSKAMQDYINAYKSYQDTLTNNADTQSAKKAYNDYVANLNKSIAGVGYQRGAEVPLSLVRGTQAKLLSQAQPEEARLQGEVQIATDAQNAAREAAKTGVDLYGNLLTNEQKQAELKQQQANEDRKFNEDVRQFGLKQAQDLQIARLQASNKSNPAPTQAQLLTNTYAQRIAQSNGIFDSLANQISGLGTIKYAAESALPNFAQPALIQQQKQAEKNFLNAVLRRESGAVISPSEYSSGAQQYFPRPGDSPEVLAQKKANRDNVQRTFIQGSGSAYEEPTAVIQLGSGKGNSSGFKGVPTYNGFTLPH